MKATIQPAHLAGDLTVIPSKSQAHRLLICGALADRPSRIVCPVSSDDIEATADCLRALGAQISYEAGVFFVTPIQKPRENAVLRCRQSGSTLRFLLPVAAALGAGAIFELEGRLPQRPLSPLWELLCDNGCRLERPQPQRIVLQGKLHGGEFSLAADVSSQFISGMLFALPILGGGSIHLTATAESVGYLKMTQAAMECFGIPVIWQENRFDVPAACYHGPALLTVEADWSAAAFWLCANALGAKIRCTGLLQDSAQQDRQVVQAIREIQQGNATISARHIPDLVPILAVLAAVTPGSTRFIHAQRLRSKESDRIASTLALLRSLGAHAWEQPDGLLVEGNGCLRGGSCDSFADHRIAMSGAIASLACRESVTIHGAQAVEKSYPTFWQEFARLGGRVHLEEEP